MAWFVIRTVFPPTDKNSTGNDHQERDEQQCGDDGGKYSLLAFWCCCTLVFLLFLLLWMRLLNRSLLLVDGCCLRCIELWSHLSLDKCLYFYTQRKVLINRVTLHDYFHFFLKQNQPHNRCSPNKRITHVKCHFH